MPSSTAPPGTPPNLALIPPPPNVLLYQFTVPRPGTYRINVAVGDATMAVTGQQLLVYDGNNFIATLFTNAATSGPDRYLDAQGNDLSAAQWPVLQASVNLIFQTTSVVFYIGDGSNHTYVAALQVQDATGTQTNLVLANVRRRPKQFRRTVIRPWFRRRLFALGYIPTAKTLEWKRQPRFWRRRRLNLRVMRQKGILHAALTPPPFTKPVWRRKPVFWKRRTQFRRYERGPRVYTPVAFKPPIVVSYKPLRHPVLRRRKFFTMRKKYAFLHLTVVSGVAAPGADIVVIVVN